jgi:hypothetical protein
VLVTTVRCLHHRALVQQTLKHSRCRSGQPGTDAVCCVACRREYSVSLADAHELTDKGRREALFMLGPAHSTGALVGTLVYLDEWPPDDADAITRGIWPLGAVG